MLNELDANRMN